MLKRQFLARARSLIVLAVVVVWSACPAGRPPLPLGAEGDPRYSPDGGYRIDNDTIWDFFSHRGSLRTFGQPTSRTFQFMGAPTQFFQRQIVQATSTGPKTLNLLDDGLPYTRINSSTVRPPTGPHVEHRGHPVRRATARRVVDFMQKNAPDTYDGEPVRFAEMFSHTVTLADAFPEGNGNESVLCRSSQPGGSGGRRPQDRPATREQQLRLPALPARDHALRRRELAHPGPAPGGLCQGDCAGRPASRPGRRSRVEPAVQAVRHGLPRRAAAAPAPLASTNLSNTFKLTNDGLTQRRATDHRFHGPSSAAASAAPAAAPGPVAARAGPGRSHGRPARRCRVGIGLGADSSPATAPGPTPTVRDPPPPTRTRAQQSKSLSITREQDVLDCPRLANRPVRQGHHQGDKARPASRDGRPPDRQRADRPAEGARGRTRPTRPRQEAAQRPARFGALAAGASNSAEFDLAPGWLVIICNITGHYSKEHGGRIHRQVSDSSSCAASDPSTDGV